MKNKTIQLPQEAEFVVRAVDSHTALLNIAKVWLYKWKRDEIYSLKDIYELEQAIEQAGGK